MVSEALQLRCRFALLLIFFPHHDRETNERLFHNKVTWNYSMICWRNEIGKIEILFNFSPSVNLISRKRFIPFAFSIVIFHEVSFFSYFFLAFYTNPDVLLELRPARMKHALFFLWGLFGGFGWCVMNRKIGKVWWNF